MWWRERKATRTAVPCRGWGIMKQYRLCGQGLAFPKNCKDAYRVARQSHLQVFNSNEKSQPHEILHTKVPSSSVHNCRKRGRKTVVHAHNGTILSSKKK